MVAWYLKKAGEVFYTIDSWSPASPESPDGVTKFCGPFLDELLKWIRSLRGRLKVEFMNGATAVPFSFLWPKVE